MTSEISLLVSALGTITSILERGLLPDSKWSIHQTELVACALHLTDLYSALVCAFHATDGLV